MERMSSAIASIIASLAVTFASSCSSSGPPISVGLSASSAQTDQGKSVAVTAMVANDSSGSGVSWNLVGPGSLTSQSPPSVNYVAPAPSNTSTVQSATVSASSVKDPTKTASMQISVNPLPFIAAVLLPSANLGTTYSQGVSETGGTGPFTWSIVYGALPAGLNIGSGTGMISGTPTQ